MVEDNEFLSKLSQNLLEILNDEEYYDITIEVGNYSSGKTFRAHMVILNYRSPYLRRILSNNKKKKGTLVHIKLPNILPEIFQIILRYIYGGRLSLEEYDTSDIIKILIAANELNLQELITYSQSFLIENKTRWMELNFNFIYQTSFENDSFSELQKYCTELISKEPDKIFRSLNSSFSSIPEKLLVSLIKSDNLQMSNIQVWEHVLKWGLAQNPNLPSDPTRFSNEDFNALKNSIQQCIPFIKFNNLTSEEFSGRVLPYRRALPEELFTDLLLYLLNSNNNQKNQKNIDSEIITFQHAELISKWIDKVDTTNDSSITSIISNFSNFFYNQDTTPDTTYESYKFKLLFRGSRDGFTPEKFHEICDNQSQTIIIIKVKDSNEILGGYNPIEWKSDYSYGSTEDSFIFSFRDSLENYTLSRVMVMEKKFAISNNSDCGPSFGWTDLVLNYNDDQSYCRKSSYEKLIRETISNFSIEENEVFQITGRYNN